ncbi:hypothetical protein BDV32DRAFT_161606 [Aspergillus pseudonomiae]|nr:hypothetical protein BDV32DRAFT_161606 [Aspergillus pseudonomiae]
MNSSNSCPPTDQDMVAKIYDPFYHDFDEDSFLGADYDYTHECAAYTHLSDLQGSVIPRFFGSYTLKNKDRLDPENFSKEERQDIMKQIVDGESSLYTKNVCHEDLRPQNVVVRRSDSQTLRIVIIDLGKSVIGRSRNPSNSRDESRYLPGVAISPLLRWNVHYDRHAYFRKWIDWPWQEWLEVQYKEDEVTITKEQRELWQIYDWMLETSISKT